MNTHQEDIMITFLVEGIINEENTKVMLIKRIFERYKYLGVPEVAQEKGKKDWYGETFTMLDKLSNENLERHDSALEEMCQQFHRNTMAMLEKQNRLNGLGSPKE